MPLVHPALLGRDSRDLIPTGLPPALARRVLSERADVLPAETLVEITRGFAATPRLWAPLARHDPDRRWYTRLLLSASVEVWLICWYPGQGTGVHDHNGALGALTVAAGTVAETIHDPARWSSVTGQRHHRVGASAAFSAAHVHQVRNTGRALATTVHAYSPPELPTRYQPADGRLAPDEASTDALTGRFAAAGTP
jgi:predicted metal-dependent enzyme (double-stranded beta helix superfamily)